LHIAATDRIASGAARRRARRLPVGWIAAAGLALCAGIGVAWYELAKPPAPRLTLRSVGFDALSGWADDHVAAALPAFLASCAALAGRGDAEPFDKAPRRGDFGTVGEWRPLCRQGAALPPGSDAAARQFFEASFAPALAGNNGAATGLFTGYYEVTLNASRHREGAYQTPIYRRPPEPSLYSRGEIEDGALGGKGLELLWADNPADVFFLQIQGSGQARLPAGATVRIGYDGQNGRPFVPVGRLLAERGAIPRQGVTMAAIRDWMAKHPQAAAALRREDPSYVFFREVSGDGPIGSQQVVLSAGRSLAVDRAFIALGVPIWVDAEERFAAARHRRLVVAQDTGGAIKGPVRGDLFWGTGVAAGRRAGAMSARGQYYLLLPRAVATRWPAD
jgi:membrane-bound lytic murein transglycosylase A